MVMAVHTRSFYPAVQVSAAPPWVLSGAAVDQDFQDGLYWPDATQTTISRASTGYVTNADGTLTSVASGQLRISHNTSAGGFPGFGLLVEESRTNLITNSQNINAAGWSVAGGIRTISNLQAPDGSLTAGSIGENTATTAVMEIGQTAGITITSGSNYTASAYVKGGLTNAWIIIASFSTANNFISAVFNLTTGALGETKTGSSSGTIVSTSITSLSGGWSRITITGSIGLTDAWIAVGTTTLASGNSFTAWGEPSYLHANVNPALYIWGVQLEAGAFPTSLISTSGSTVTRASDLVNATNVFGSIGVGGAMSLYFQGLGAQPTGRNNWSICLDNSTNTEDYLYLQNTAPTELRSYVAATYTNITGQVNTFGPNKFMAAGDRTNYNTVCDGSTVATNAIAYDTTTTTNFRIGSQGGGGDAGYYGGYIPRIAGWTSKLANTTLQTLTQTPPPNVDLNFASAYYFPNYLTGLVSCSRSSSGYAQNADGTLTSFGNNALRIGVGNGLLVEESRTNYLYWNFDMANAGGVSQSNVTVTSGVSLFLDGLMHGHSIIENTSNTQHKIFWSSISKAASAITYTCSAYIKVTGTGTVRTVNFFIGNSSFGGWASASWNPSTGAYNNDLSLGGSFTAVTPVNGTLIGNGWYRVYLTFTSDTDTVLNPYIQLNGGATYTGDGVSGAWVTGAQLEAGAFPTSLIATLSGSSVTRAADVVTGLGSTITTFDSTVGSALVITSSIQSANNTSALFAGGGSRQPMTPESSGAGLNSYGGGTTLHATLGSGNYTTGTVKSAVAWDGTGRSLVGNNGTVATDANTIGTATGTVYIGQWGSTSANALVNGYITRVAGWTYRLSDPIIQALTV